MHKVAQGQIRDIQGKVKDTHDIFRRKGAPNNDNFKFNLSCKRSIYLLCKLCLICPVV